LDLFLERRGRVGTIRDLNREETTL